jgi:hypothetical protein
VLIAASTRIKLHLIKMVGELNSSVRTPAFFTTNTDVGQWLHPPPIIGNARQKRADFRLFGRLKGASCLIESVFHAATLATFFELHPTSDLIERRRCSWRHTSENVWSLRHRLFQSGLMFFQLRESENATPILTNSQTALNSPGVPAEARVAITIRLNVGE